MRQHGRVLVRFARVDQHGALAQEGDGVIGRDGLQLAHCGSPSG